MADLGSYPLRVVDGLALSPEYRAVLRPGELMQDRDGRRRRLPRWFLEVPSWEAALETPLSPHFLAWEFLNVDVREHELLRTAFPRYLPLGTALLATALEVLRAEVGTYVHIAANGAYRTPAHGLVRHATPHCWGTAANLYRIGNDTLDNESAITRYSRVARSLGPAYWARPYGHGIGQTDDHLHVDLGFAVVMPHAGEGETDSAPA